MAFGTFALVVMVVGYAVGAVLSLVASSDRAARVFTALGAVVGGAGGLGAAVSVLTTGIPLDVVLPNVVAAAGGLVIRLDLLGAFFLAHRARACQE